MKKLVPLLPLLLAACSQTRQTIEYDPATVQSANFALMVIFTAFALAVAVWAVCWAIVELRRG